MKLIKSLWYGNVCPIEEIAFLEHSDKRLAELYTKNKNALLPTLNDWQKENLEKICDLWTEMQQNGQCNAFITGFRLGVQLMTESVCEYPE